MPRVHTLKANKAYPDIGVAKGDTYYKWTTRPGGRGKGIVHRSKTYPKPQQLTSSDFLIQVYDLQDRLDDLAADDTLEGERDSIAEDIRALGEEQADKLSNMPDSLQSSPSGETLQNRADACEAWADDIESVEIPEAPDDDEEPAAADPDADDDDAEDPQEEYQAAIEAALEEIQNCTYQGD